MELYFTSQSTRTPDSEPDRFSRSRTTSPRAGPGAETRESGLASGQQPVSEAPCQPAPSQGPC